jgi:hypothetical protein
VSDEGNVLAANSAFYAAFAEGDYDAMDSLWAREAPVACVHPGWPPVRGRDQVMSAWKGLLQNPPRPAIRALREHTMMFGDVATVVCFEAIGDITLVATNIFAREGGIWKMVHHQAAVTNQVRREETGGDKPRRLH